MIQAGGADAVCVVEDVVVCYVEVMFEETDPYFGLESDVGAVVSTCFGKCDDVFEGDCTGEDGEIDGCEG